MYFKIRFILVIIKFFLCVQISRLNSLKPKMNEKSIQLFRAEEKVFQNLRQHRGKYPAAIT